MSTRICSVSKVIVCKLSKTLISRFLSISFSSCCLFSLDLTELSESDLSLNTLKRFLFTRLEFSAPILYIYIIIK